MGEGGEAKTSYLELKGILDTVEFLFVPVRAQGLLGFGFSCGLLSPAFLGFLWSGHGSGTLKHHVISWI